MLNILIDEILAKEAEAEDIVRKAEAEARAVRLSADVDSEKRRGRFFEERRIAREQTYANAEKKAEKSYDEAIKEAEKEAEKLRRNAEKRMDEAVNLILGRLIGK